MRCPNTRASSDDGMSLNMTPMIDVVFQLLIFFVCTTNFQALEELLPTQLRALGAIASAMPLDPQLAELEDVRIKIETADGRVSWEINGQRLSEWAQLQPLLIELAQ